MSNQAILIDLWKQAGQEIDQQRLRIFKLMSESEQQRLLDQIRDELKQPSIA